MNLKSFVFSTKGAPEKYWSVIIEPDWVQSGIWVVRDGKAEVLSFSQPLPWNDNESLVDVIDSSLSVSVGNLSEDDLEISKTVFGLASSWVSSDGDIKPDYRGLIKDVCQKLSLNPVGFVVLDEALAHYLKSEENAPLNAIIVGLGEKNLSVSLYVEGVNKGEFVVSRSLSIVEDVVEGLSRFSYDNHLPPRVLVYNGREGEIDGVIQELISANWSEFETISFLHTPKIEAVSFEDKIKAVSLAGGVELLGATSVFSEERVADDDFDKKDEVDTVGEFGDADLSHGDNFSSVGKSNLGFVIDKDIKEIGEKVMGKNIIQDTDRSPRDVGVPRANVKKTGVVDRLSLPLVFLNKFSAFFLSGKNNVLLLTGLLSILLASVVIFAIWWFVPKASVVIYLSPKKIESSQSIVFDTNVDKPDIDKRVIPTRLIKKEISGEKTIQTSGTKLTGERAKGKVVIYRTGPELSLNKGTKFQSTSGLVFILDDNVIVASGSASSPTKTEAQITAGDIGSEYNLAAGESFSVGNYPRSEIEAKNEQEFSGGSSREVSSVSPNDYEKVFYELKKELSERAVSDMKGLISDEEYIVVETLFEDEKQKNYDRKVGDESSTLKLDLKLEFSAFSFRKSDMFQLSKEILKDQITSGYILREGQLSLDFELKERKNDKAVILTSFSANLLPAIDTSEIKKKIAGRSVNFVEEYLINNSGYDRVEIDIMPSVFRKFMVLPHIDRNIEVQFEAIR